MLIRAAFFIVFLLMAFLLSASLLAWFGIKDFFYLVLDCRDRGICWSSVLSMTFYRPFCRLICPYGGRLSLGTWKGLFKLQRTDACIECKKCEKACPTDEAKRDDG